MFNRNSFTKRGLVKTLSSLFYRGGLSSYDLSNVSHKYYKIDKLKSKADKEIYELVVSKIQKKYKFPTDPFVTMSSQGKKFLDSFGHERFIKVGAPDLFFESNNKLIFIEVKLNEDAIRYTQIDWFDEFSKRRDIDCYIVHIISKQKKEGKNGMERFYEDEGQQEKESRGFV